MIPKRPKANLEWRMDLMERAEKNEGMQQDLLDACAESVIFYVNFAGMTYHQFDVDAKGKKGPLAEAIYAMPDERIVFARATLNVTATRPTNPVSLQVVDPRGTSQVHVGCGGRLKRSKGHYDLAPCKKCGNIVNTHDNSAQAVVYLAQGRPLIPEL